MNRKNQIDATTPLDKCPECTVGLQLPIPLSARVDDLVTLVEKASERTTRKEVIAALIYAAPEDHTALSKIIRRYREAHARDAPIGHPSTPRIPLASHKPGPRRRKKA